MRDVSNPKDWNEWMDRTGRGHGSLPRSKKGGGGAYVNGSTDRCREETRGGMEPSSSETGRMPPFRAGGGETGAPLRTLFLRTAKSNHIFRFDAPRTQTRRGRPRIPKYGPEPFLSHRLTSSFRWSRPPGLERWISDVSSAVLSGAHVWGGFLDQTKREPHIVT